MLGCKGETMKKNLNAGERPKELEYLYSKPKKIRWKWVAGPELLEAQEYDLVYDAYDFKIRQLQFIPHSAF